MNYNPYQFQPTMGYQQAFQPAISQQQFQTQSSTPQLAGRFVSSPEEITPQEVSMSSTPSLFPLADGSAIIAKQWANDGTIKTVTYTAELETKDEPGITLADISNQLDDMRDILDGLKTQRKPTTRRKPDAED